MASSPCSMSTARPSPHRLQQAPLELPAAISIGRQVADAVAEAHRHGIVHRDIKPQNVMLSAANHATVLDFGLAKAAAPVDEASQTATVLTEAGVVSGTLLYMSPEQARAEVVDERSDVFSFGIVLYELVTRAHPFAHDNWADTLASILTRDPRPIEVPIPSELRRILRKCLEKDRARRYQTMRDVATDLENLAQEMSNASTEALPPATTPAAVRRPTHRTPVARNRRHRRSGRSRRGNCLVEELRSPRRCNPATRPSPTSPILRLHPRCRQMDGWSRSFGAGRGS